MLIYSAQAYLKQALYVPKMKELTYFITRNTSKTVHCENIEDAKKIIELSNIAQNLTKLD